MATLRDWRLVSACLLFFLLSAISSKIWFPPAIVFKATIESDERFLAQVFYDENDSGRFSSERVINILVSKGKSRLVVPIPAKRIVGFRIDFGWEPGKVRLSKPRLSGQSTVWLHGNGFVFSKDVIGHSADADDTIDIAFQKGDPYAIYKPRFEVEPAQRAEALFKHLPLACLFFLFLALTSRFLVKLAASSAVRVRDHWKCDAEWAEEGGWISSFDFLRVIAFLFVVFAHLLTQANAHDFPSRLQPQLMPWGPLGVSIFIVLSGASLSVGSFRKSGTWRSFYIRRLRTILPPFWCAYFVCLMLQFGVFGSMHTGRSLLSFMPTLFGVDGYLSPMVPTYAMIGEWYLGFILLLYMLAPAIHRMVERTPLAALAALFAVSLLSARMTPFLKNYIPFWSPIPRFNVLSHVFEFSFGMVFVRFMRPGFHRYAIFALLSGMVVATHVSVAKGPWFDFTPMGILMSVALFVAMCFAFDALATSKAAADIVSSLGKASFLAFLYHHKVIYWFVSHGKQMDNFQLSYNFLFIVTISYALAYASMKPAKALERLVFGET